ncbi:glycoside hydrolase family 2 [Fusarium albosuccineum]|uniref:Glycoside hydrolase family 2 n=1 Tax=Fusarium albosuccineum TaxID=1237068 RepID=A0A8H4PL22_9HYPO|nr:glycoside hydrolase family 2 [Fusarium albosuccineum]
MTYPRPDFERNPLRWETLNGQWDFLFDDGDAGLSENWQRSGLPEKATVFTSSTRTEASAESDSVVQKIVGDTQALIQNNVFTESSKTTHSKTKIKVPFVFQSPASGINDRGVHEVLWYERAISDLRTTQEKEQGHRLVLRFGAVDYEATVWVNGEYVGGHRGGHVPFEIDITGAVSGTGESNTHRLTLRVYDSAYDLTQPRGKQYWGAKPESIFYTPSGGIWQNVWLEVVPSARIADSSSGTVIKSNDIHSGQLRSTIVIKGRKFGKGYSVELEAGFAGVPVAKSDKKALPRETDSVAVDLSVRLSEEQRSKLPQSVTQDAPLDNDSCWRDGVALWSPEHPQLYDLVIRLFDDSGKIIDEVKTTTGMRSIDWTKGDGLWRLNDKPYFQALCLDQGYWPETFMTPPTPESLKVDIELAKKMGLNGCRKHQKVEDPLFYYWADKLGYLVWGEMANAYQFSQEYVERFNAEWTEAVKLVINRPSVVTWTPVNESWGYGSLKDNVDQRNHIRQLYYLTKGLDNTRSINDNCGWEHVLTDLTTFHDYSDGPELEKTCADLNAILGQKAGRDMFVPPIPGVDEGARHKAGTPVMNTEFGGVNIAPAKKEDAGGDESRDWGYTTATNPDDLVKRIDRLVKGTIEGGHCCAFVYTQLADIEQEVNGLYTFDREEKLDSTKVKALINDAIQTFYNRVK